MLTQLRPAALCSLLLGALGACQADADLGPATEPVPAPTPYALTIPSGLSARVPADNPLTNEGVALGRFLFYDPVLSVDSTVSCSSCHQQAKAFTDGRAKSRGVGGRTAARSAMSLANVMWNEHLNWDAHFTRLEDQNRAPIENPNEMGQPLSAAVQRLQRSATYPRLFERAFGTRVITEALMLKALTQFERTLISANSRYDQFLRTGTGLTEEEKLGARLFGTHPVPDLNPMLTTRGGNCGDCHSAVGLFRFLPDKVTSNGLDVAPTDQGKGAITGQAADMGTFVVPTVRNIALTAPYMHDGRFATLEEVLDHYNEHVERAAPNLGPDMSATNILFGESLGLEPDEKRAIIAFLKTLTDSTFITDPRFANPRP